MYIATFHIITALIIQLIITGAIIYRSEERRVGKSVLVPV